MTVDFLF